MLTTLLMVLAQAPACGVEVANAGGSDCETATRGDHGWKTLVKREQWEVIAIRSKKKAGSDGLCAKEEERGLLAFRGAQFKAGPVEGVAVSADQSTCVLSKAAVTIKGVKWTLAPNVAAARLELTSENAKWVVPVESMCWTEGWLGELDGDGVPDVVLTRSGAGSLTTLFLSASGKKARHAPCGVVNVLPL